MFAAMMARCIDELEVTPTPRVFANGRRRYVSYGQAVRLMKLLSQSERESGDGAKRTCSIGMDENYGRPLKH